MKFEQVFEEELEELGKRRASSGEAGESPARDELVGLCFSGGGIRSAVFNLGLARGLQRWGLLERVDYLSTVSGGGYMGSCIANHLRLDKRDELLAARASYVGEPSSITRLRAYGRFVTPQGSLGEWLQVFVAIVRGVLWNMLGVFALAIGLAALCSVGLDGAGQWRFPFAHGHTSAVAVALLAGLMMLSVLRRRSPDGRALVAMVTLAAVVAAVDVLPQVLALLAGHERALSWAVLSSGAGALLGSGVLDKLPARVYLVAARGVALLLALLVPLGLFFVVLLRLVSASAPTGVELGVALAFALGLIVVDVNRSSLHGLYAERVAAAFHDGESPKLSAFAGAAGPLHLLNVALNVAPQTDASVRDRRADFFSFSCLHYGGPRTGYAPTTALEQAKPDFSLASAVAISGAAAAPNMGSYTDTLLRPLLTLLNVRMGYWAPHPRALLAGGSGWTPRLPRLFAELGGQVSSEGKLVNISDGGHLENLGAFELLRRRCKLIIIGDGEADPDACFGAIATLVRFARVELNAEISIDLDDLRMNEAGLSTKHAALGTVRYPDGSVGRILYLKSSLTGREPPDVRYYKDRNPDFPHESTADQWFDDAQFDAYLSLGEEVVDNLFRRLGYAGPAELEASGSSWDERMAALALVLAPSSRSRAPALVEQLGELMTQLLDPQFAAYRAQLMPTIYAEPIPQRDLHRIAPAVMLQLQLMERAVSELGLSDAYNRASLANRGWMNVFARWAKSEAFARLALVCLPSFGAELGHFVRTTLGIGARQLWREHPQRSQLLVLSEENPEIDAARGRMPTGLAELRREEEAVVIERLALRPGFGGQDRRATALAALRAYFSAQELRFEGEAARLARSLPNEAYLLNPKSSHWSAADEELLLELAREGATDLEQHPGDAVFAMGFEPPMG